MDKLKGIKAMMIVDLPKEKLYMRDRVEILKSWKEPLFLGEHCLGTRKKIRIKSLDRIDIEADIDFADVLISEYRPRE